MKKTDQNIIMITAGGVGSRFGSDTPKQYLSLNGKPVISYVIEACRQCPSADSVLVVADPAYHDELRETYGVDVVASGRELNNTKWNGMKYISENSSCRKLIVADAVRPTIEPRVLDNMFSYLDDYDAVACARKITDSLGRYGEWVVDRSEYYTLNAPEAFRFDLIFSNFDAGSKYTESLQQLPESSRIFLYFDVPYFDKITVPEDLMKLEALLQWKESQRV